jgi:hypothetical protein
MDFKLNPVPPPLRDPDLSNLVYQGGRSRIDNWTYRQDQPGPWHIVVVDDAHGTLATETLCGITSRPGLRSKLSPTPPPRPFTVCERCEARLRELTGGPAHSA